MQSANFVRLTLSTDSNLQQGTPAVTNHHSHTWGPRFVWISAHSVIHLSTAVALWIVTKLSHYTLSAWLTVTYSNIRHFITKTLSLMHWPYSSAAGMKQFWGLARDRMACRVQPNSSELPLRGYGGETTNQYKLQTVGYALSNTTPGKLARNCF